MACEIGVSIGGAYGGDIWGRGGKPAVFDAKRVLRSSAWRHVYRGLNIDKIAPASDRSRFEREMDDPPEFTIDNIRATFGAYIVDQRGSILRGLAEAFVDLDPAYKSHSKVRIGVKGLPKRVIINGAAARHSYGSLGADRLRDMLNALRVYRGEDHLEHAELSEWKKEARKAGDAARDGITLRAFNNGNMHVLFDPTTCRDINMALAEFYGEVLPDAEDGDQPRRAGRDVAKDLAYYPTPVAVADRLVGDLYPHDDMRILEPSCGCGRILDSARKAYRHAIIRGIEVDPGRAALSRSKGYAVTTGNFLDVPPDPTFDAVLMNPPFVGRHWRKHLDHARRFLRQRDRGRGVIRCILPASAWYDGHLEGVAGQWRDLPVASFAESGTNVPTGIFTTWGDQ
ncbi:DUF4942 domain-containing protein [Loktanella sp. 3ANDIMAR09]|uniref:DUF4942 domain-containing protein n=1 Tax=Loktanella sp. 3ANDIMAR09 TaxID=1225657 RepID=UPI001C10F505|nr:DUF4942 domain-containing protein [Loktanella sp. 3ANDIMAR09]